MSPAGHSCFHFSSSPLFASLVSHISLCLTILFSQRPRIPRNMAASTVHHVELRTAPFTSCLKGIKKTFGLEPNQPKASPSVCLPSLRSEQNVYSIPEEFDVSGFNDDSLSHSIFPPLELPTTLTGSKLFKSSSGGGCHGDWKLVSRTGCAAYCMVGRKASGPCLDFQMEHH